MYLCKWTWGEWQYTRDGKVVKGTSTLSYLTQWDIKTIKAEFDWQQYFGVGDANRSYNVMSNQESFSTHTSLYNENLTLLLVFFHTDKKLAFTICAVVTRRYIYAFLKFGCCPNGKLPIFVIRRFPVRFTKPCVWKFLLLPRMSEFVMLGGRCRGCHLGALSYCCVSVALAEIGHP